MKELEVTVFVYNEDPFEAHISSEGVESGVNQSNVHKIYLGYENLKKVLLLNSSYLTAKRNTLGVNR